MSTSNSGQGTADVLIRQAKDRLLNGNQHPNDAVLVVLGTVLYEIRNRLPIVNGGLSRVKKLAVPSAGAVGGAGILYTVLDVLKSL